MFMIMQGGLLHSQNNFTMIFIYDFLCHEGVQQVAADHNCWISGHLWMYLTVNSHSRVTNYYR